MRYCISGSNNPFGRMTLTSKPQRLVFLLNVTIERRKIDVLRVFRLTSETDCYLVNGVMWICRYYVRVKCERVVFSMSWLKQKIGGSVRSDKSAVRSPSGLAAEQNHRTNGGRVPVNSADTENHMQLTESQWNSASSVLQRDSFAWTDDDWTVVQKFCDELLRTLEVDDHSTYVRLTDFLLSFEVLEKLVTCLVPSTTSKPTSHGRSDRLRLSLLRLFDLLLSQSSESSLLTERRLTKPLLRLLSMCGGDTSGEPVDSHLIAVLHQLCVGITQFPAVLDLLFGGDMMGQTENENGSTSSDVEKSSSNQFLVFSLLVPFVHREGHAAQQARDDLLLIMSLSSALSSISCHIVDHSDFCPVCLKGNVLIVRGFNSIRV